jgi:hypothetical protein
MVLCSVYPWGSHSSKVHTQPWASLISDSTRSA